jgi:hemin uptake protein HemP
MLGGMSKDKMQDGNKQNNVHQTMSVPVLDSKQLFDGVREIRLRHCSEEYRLILTKNNKLILMK